MSEWRKKGFIGEHQSNIWSRFAAGKNYERTGLWIFSAYSCGTSLDSATPA
jgi:hypothetical protein